jgi:acetyl-CoA acetyltransferase
VGGKDACIVGVGTSDTFGFDLGKSPVRLQTEAFGAALDDAGWSKDRIDGVITSHGSPSGVDYDEFVLATGLDTRWASQRWSHGRWATTSVAEAALVVEAGLASCVAVIDTGISARGYGRHLTGLTSGRNKEALRDMGGGHGEWDVHGLDTPGAATALIADRYMRHYRATSNDLAEIAVAFRNHASRNPMAIMNTKPMTRESYFDEPVIVNPLRRADFCLSSEGSVCLLVTSSERARDAARPAVRIAGIEGIHTSRDDYVLFARPGLGVGIEAEESAAVGRQPELYARSGIDRSAVDALYIYDSFSCNVWTVLERFGFCGLGEAADYIRTAGLGLDSQLPVNTNGGLLSEVMLFGYSHLVEMVRQLRGEAGARQIEGASVAQWASPRGDSLLFTKID